MLLNNEVTLLVDNQDFKLSSVDVVIIDDSSRKIVLVKLAPFLKPLLLWKGNHYDGVGDYTQNQVENKILELLGEDQQSVLQSLVI